MSSQQHCAATRLHMGPLAMPDSQRHCCAPRVAFRGHGPPRAASPTGGRHRGFRARRGESHARPSHTDTQARQRQRGHAGTVGWWPRQPHQVTSTEGTVDRPRHAGMSTRCPAGGAVDSKSPLTAPAPGPRRRQPPMCRTVEDEHTRWRTSLSAITHTQTAKAHAAASACCRPEHGDCEGRRSPSLRVSASGSGRLCLASVPPHNSQTLPVPAIRRCSRTWSGVFLHRALKVDPAACSRVRVTLGRSKDDLLCCANRGAPHGPGHLAMRRTG